MVLENLESPIILFWHFTGPESPERRLMVLESLGNLLDSSQKFVLEQFLSTVLVQDLNVVGVCGFDFAKQSHVKFSQSTNSLLILPLARWGAGSGIIQVCWLIIVGWIDVEILGMTGF